MGLPGLATGVKSRGAELGAEKIILFGQTTQEQVFVHSRQLQTSNSRFHKAYDRLHRSVQSSS